MPNLIRVSVTAAPLASWVVASRGQRWYSKVTEKIRPLEREQYKLQQNLQSTEEQMEQLSTGLSDVASKVAELKVQLSTDTKELAKIEINLKEAEDKLHNAEGLVDKLQEVYNRWQMQTDINVLILDPSSLTVQWLRAHLKHRAIEVIT